MAKETLKLSGKLQIVHRDKDGNIKQTREHDNLIVNAGLDFITSRMLGASKAVMSHMALGSDGTAAAAGQTDLGTTLGSRKALGGAVQSGSNNEQIVFTTTFAAGEATGAVAEAGIFNAATGGDMLCRTAFPVVNKAAGDTIAITWTITFSVS